MVIAVILKSMNYILVMITREETGIDDTKEFSPAAHDHDSLSIFPGFCCQTQALDHSGKAGEMMPRLEQGTLPWAHTALAMGNINSKSSPSPQIHHLQTLCNSSNVQNTTN